MPLSRRSLVVWAAPLLVVAQVPAVAAADPPPESGSAKVKRGPFRLALSEKGVLVPATGNEIAFWPATYRGELRIAEVVPHGTRVKKGDAVLRLDSEAVETMVREAEWNVRVAETQLADQQAAAREREADSRQDLADAEKALAFAEKDLAGYVEIQRQLDKEEHESSERDFRYNIDDQQDELAQLGKMYKEDELTEETEEIVLKRSRRNLEQVKKRLDLFQRHRRYADEFQEPEKRQALESAAVAKRRALRNLRRSMESASKLAAIDLEKAEERNRTAQRALEDLRHDREQFTFRAAAEGIVLHGDFLAGTLDDDPKVKVLRPGELVQPYQTLLTVADTGGLKARFTLKAEHRHRVEAGTAAALVAAALPEKSIAASVEAPAALPGADGAWKATAVFGAGDPRLLPGLECQVNIVLADEPDVLTAPCAALFQKGDRWICYVRDGSPFGVAARVVVPGPSDGKATVIREGLREGDEVILNPKEPGA